MMDYEEFKLIGEEGNEPYKGFLMLDHLYTDRVLPLLSPAAQSIFLRIIRQTIGWQKSKTRKKKKVWDTISHSQFKKWCNIKSTNTVKTAVSRLEELDLIEVKAHNRKPSEYRVNIDEVDAYRGVNYEHPLYQKLI